MFKYARLLGSYSKYLFARILRANATSGESTELSAVWKIKQRFGEGSQLTKVFDSWDKSTQALFLEKVNLENGEIPVLAHYQPSANWLLVTTSRLVWANPNQQYLELPLDDVEKVGWSSGPPGWPGRDPDSPPDTMVLVPNGKGHCSFYSPWLHVVDVCGNRFELFLEPGKVLRAMRNSIWHLSGGWKRAGTVAEQFNESRRNACQAETGSDAYKARRIESDILRCGDEYRALLFASLPSGAQDFLLAEAHLDQRELPVFAFFDDSETWLLATTRRVIWSRPGFKHQLRYEQVGSTGQSEFDKLNAVPDSPERWEERKREIGRIKSSSPWFYIEDDLGNRYEAILPAGGTLYMIWNLIRHMQIIVRIHPIKD